MANVKNIKRHRTNRVSIDDFHYKNNNDSKQLFRSTEIIKPISNASAKRISKKDDIFYGTKHFGALVLINGAYARIYRNYIDNNYRHLLFFNGKPTTNKSAYSSSFRIVEFF